MKRFYCTICQQVRRVRKLPAHVETSSSDVVTNRRGVCNFHFDYTPRTVQSKVVQSKSEPVQVQVSRKTLRKLAGVK